MCGRVTLTRASLEDIASELDATFDPDDVARYKPRYNGAPSDLLWLLVADENEPRPRIVPASWGLPTKSRPAVNVKAETLKRGAFRSRRRSIAITDGFYEWQGPKKARQPFLFRRESGLLLLAAVDTPLDASTRAGRAFAIVTVPAGPDLERFHDRQPAIIERADIDRWLEAERDDERLALLAPAAGGTLQARPVSTRVNFVANDDASCLDDAPPTEAAGPRQLSLLDG
jgi:putative SOS response-associated peptidase YedK